MRGLFIHRFCGWGVVTIGVYKRCQGLDRLWMQSDFLSLKVSAEWKMLFESFLK